ncbi:MAG: dipeptide ABC transporter ATP-binding protein [Chloroflexi bacterium]|nr:MAG: dipeptide ABC transporter ATP-binding protein [Chloroflexota bacterium]TMC74047.1 MAG: dipeptide ABC transporter ATP-binding protein [Chloroflexota bacterium]
MSRELVAEVEAASPTRKGPLLEVRDLVKHFPIKGGLLQLPVAWVKAVDGVSFDIQRGETLGLVGESGSGKSTVARTILRLIPPTSGEVLLEGKSVFKASANEMKKIRRDMQIIFQDPYGSLNPRMPVGEIIAEGLVVHGIGSPKEREAAVNRLLEIVGLRGQHRGRFPHEFSGGQRQRIGIARALALTPNLVIADEPVSALDVSIQSQVLNLLSDLQKEFNLTYLFVAHNMAVVEQVSDRIAVMYLGKIVEVGPAEELVRNPKHPYTQALISAVPVPDPAYRRERTVLKGDIPSPINPPSGCHFRTRCPIATERCAVEEPLLRPVGKDQIAACHYA